MDNSKFLEQLECTGIVPVIKLENTDDAVHLAKALYDGGIHCAEVTFRAEGADKVIGDMVKAYPDMLVGAGTVLTTEQCDRAIEAGAKFCVAPGLNPKVVKHCLDKGVPFAPGVANGSQIEQAMELGLDFVKFFPAEQAGGLPYIKAVSAPYSNMKFMPTGGVNENNLNTYLAFKKIVCCGGSWIVPDKLVKAGKWEEITALCRSAVNKMLGFSLAHIGINCNNENAALEVSSKFDKLFGWEQKVGNSSVFAGGAVECMKSPFKGEKGHIAVSTNSVRRAVYQLAHQGIEADMSTAKYDTDGRLTVVYLKEDFGGFAVHFVEKK
ncbi:bifunctional 4-hydroxy-2-oxoglutarate aldolase/2-dehydro-3-deoxy-phosphogluconate aldolase [Ruminococcus sp.]|uniref:bifunctional 4-hydroxy-2-oxoglutarate aldolase/2-dehydro-3-deoxy-phosphogluconate aldolase n=1 Tax=Ruminococcus sp. TaxID=41978 RepID=UPI0025CE1844|nr:bifunctional 4-hydroxy-2-oxoglutarate aldolase/2-dehydro-3-deoxy-phosphogluconate aldolase [Ruminococcus sp.]MBQ8967422.1 bifunctional 4-hydroxy-2-oxoglutarate aldolase/2-dehydro-3-deoxy-phosphogluconate aldolase [Ruminococcus sp.]